MDRVSRLPISERSELPHSRQPVATSVTSCPLSCCPTVTRPVNEKGQVWEKAVSNRHRQAMVTGTARGVISFMHPVYDADIHSYLLEIKHLA